MHIDKSKRAQGQNVDEVYPDPDNNDHDLQYPVSLYNDSGKIVTDVIGFLAFLGFAVIFGNVLIT